MNLSETNGDVSFIILKNYKTIVDTSMLNEILNFGTWTIDGKYVSTIKRHENGKRKKVETEAKRTRKGISHKKETTGGII